METITIELRGLKAAKGMVLTNGADFSDVGGLVFLGVTDKAENWSEITETEAAERQKAAEEENNSVLPE